MEWCQSLRRVKQPDRDNPIGKAKLMINTPKVDDTVSISHSIWIWHSKQILEPPVRMMNRMRKMWHGGLHEGLQDGLQLGHVVTQRQLLQRETQAEIYANGL
jgi:hypothetical protein